jgi:hypothetical protein
MSKVSGASKTFSSRFADIVESVMKAGVENVAIEFDVLEREARYRCHAGFETQGFRHGARHQTGDRGTLLPTALGAGATEPSGRRERHGSCIMPATMTNKS